MNRAWSPAEIDLLAHAWGPGTLWHHLPMRVWPGGVSRVEFDTDDPVNTRRIYLTDDATNATKVHEAGHAIHLSLYPESAHWATLKCETFAMIGVVFARLDEVYGELPEVVAARRIVAAEPMRYDRAMKMAAEMDG